jgi:hypothetical protein
LAAAAQSASDRANSSKLDGALGGAGRTPLLEPPTAGTVLVCMGVVSGSVNAGHSNEEDVARDHDGRAGRMCAAGVSGNACSKTNPK